MSYFVADDAVHVRVGDHSVFVSACGYEYPRVAVDWADEFEPEAWPPCEDCLATGPPNAPDDAVVILGVYALDEDAHLLIGRDGTAWVSLCGRVDPNIDVAWAGHEWPEAYDECPACAAMVLEDVSPSGNDESAVEATDAVPTAVGSLARNFRLWVVADDEIEHRPSDESLTRAMCGVKLRRGNVQRTAPNGGAKHCHACDRAVGKARAASRPKPAEPNRRRAPVRPVRRRGKRTQTPIEQQKNKKKRRRRSETDKELALYGRKMIVPVRFVRGGLPTLGRRR